MSQPTPTPAWGTPVAPTGTASNPAAETQVLPPVSQVAPQAPRPAGPTRGEVELRGTALYYATRILGDQGSVNPDAKLSTTLRLAKGLEAYLLTGNA